MEPLTKILIIRLSSIGDIIQCSGVPGVLKKAYPQSEVHWLVRSDNSDLIRFNSYVNRIISFDRAEKLKGWLALARILRSENYTHVYDAHNNLRSHIMTFYIKSPHFIRRTKSRFKRFLLFTFKMNLFSKPYVPAQSYIEPLKPWGVRYDNEGGEITLPKNVLEKVRTLMPEKGVWIALAPATAWPKKTWPLAYWKSLVTDLIRGTDYSLLILGGPKDNFCEELVLDSSRVLTLQGKLSLLESAAAASLCNTLIAADTGLLHMAECLKINVVALIGPTPFGYPNRQESKTLEVDLWCKPCSKDGSGPCINPIYQKCMKDITPRVALETVKKVLGIL